MTIERARRFQFLPKLGFAGILIGTCAAVLAMPAPPAASTQAGDDTTHSASLAGVKRWEDATPADLADEASYRLPGFFDKDTTLDNIRRRFGAANVKIGEIDGSEGEKITAVVLFGGDPARRAEVFLRDQERQRGVASIRLRGSKTRWQVDGGVRLGMKLDALVAANGKPVSFSGLDWDYGGIVTDWHGGKLAPRKGDNLSRSVGLAHASNASGFPMGEGTYRSDDAHFSKQGSALFVGDISVIFAGPDDD